MTTLLVPEAAHSKPERSRIVPHQVGTGSSDRVANMRAFTAAELDLLGRGLA